MTNAVTPATSRAAFVIGEERIARRVVERHGGTLESESDADGTTVRVRLPD